jgi:hypothetical protein
LRRALVNAQAHEQRRHHGRAGGVDVQQTVRVKIGGVGDAILLRELGRNLLELMPNIFDIDGSSRPVANDSQAGCDCRLIVNDWRATAGVLEARPAIRIFGSHSSATSRRSGNSAGGCKR